MKRESLFDAQCQIDKGWCMIVARSLSLAEPDTAEVRTLAPLRILSLEGEEVAHYHAPKGGWTHDSLECVDYFSVSPDGWDAYLGDQWLGSSKV